MNKLLNSPKLKAIKIIIIRSLPELVNDLVLILIFVFLNLFTTKNKKLTIVSAADESHFYSVQNLFYTLEMFEKNSTLIFYDIGLNNNQKDELKSNFPNIIYKNFDFDSYPDFVSKKDKDGKVGSYA